MRFKEITDSKSTFVNIFFKQKKSINIPVSQFTTLKELFAYVLDTKKKKWRISKGRLTFLSTRNILNFSTNLKKRKLKIIEPVNNGGFFFLIKNCFVLGHKERSNQFEFIYWM